MGNMKSKAFLKIKDILNEFAKSLNDSNSTKTKKKLLKILLGKLNQRI